MAKKLPNPMLKTFQKSWTNPPQPRKNRCQNLPKSSPRRSKIEVWRGFRWKSLSDPKLSPLFSAPGGRLGASWERLGRVSGSSWGRLGSLGAPWKRLEGVVGRLGSVLELLAYTPWKSTPKTIDFTSENGPPDLQKSSPHCSESMILQILRFSRFPWIWARFWCQLGSILKGFWVSWGGLGASWGLLGASWGRLGAPWSVLGRPGASWGRLGAVLALKNLSKKTCL